MNRAQLMAGLGLAIACAGPPDTPTTDVVFVRPYRCYHKRFGYDVRCRVATLYRHLRHAPLPWSLFDSEARELRIQIMARLRYLEGEPDYESERPVLRRAQLELHRLCRRVVTFHGRADGIPYERQDCAPLDEADRWGTATVPRGG